MTSNQIYQINVSRKRTNEEKNYRIFTYKGWCPPSCRNYPQIIVVNNCTSYIKPNQADCHENLHSTHHYGKVLRVILVSSFPCSLRQKIYKSQHIHQIYYFTLILMTKNGYNPNCIMYIFQSRYTRDIARVEYRDRVHPKRGKKSLAKYAQAGYSYNNN